jgi:tRNA pseudouridine55 synthase
LEALLCVQLSDEQTISIRYGQSINYLKSSVSSLEMEQGIVRMYHAAVFLGLGEMGLDGKIAPKKLFNMNNQ